MSGTHPFFLFCTQDLYAESLNAACTAACRNLTDSVLESPAYQIPSVISKRPSFKALCVAYRMWFCTA